MNAVPNRAETVLEWLCIVKESQSLLSCPHSPSSSSLAAACRTPHSPLAACRRRRWRRQAISDLLYTAWRLANCQLLGEVTPFSHSLAGTTFCRRIIENRRTYVAALICPKSQSQSIALSRNCCGVRHIREHRCEVSGTITA